MSSSDNMSQPPSLEDADSKSEDDASRLSSPEPEEEEGDETMENEDEAKEEDGAEAQEEESEEEAPPEPEPQPKSSKGKGRGRGKKAPREDEEEEKEEPAPPKAAPKSKAKAKNGKKAPDPVAAAPKGNNGRYAHRINKDGTESVRHKKRRNISTHTDEDIGYRVDKASVRRLCWRSGAKTIRKNVYPTVQGRIASIIADLVVNGAIIADGSKRKTLTHGDIQHAIHVHGSQTLYTAM